MRKDIIGLGSKTENTVIIFIICQLTNRNDADDANKQT